MVLSQKEKEAIKMGLPVFTVSSVAFSFVKWRFNMKQSLIFFLFLFNDRINRPVKVGTTLNRC